MQAREGGGPRAVPERAGSGPSPLGVRTQIAGEYEKPKGVIGVVVAPKFPDLEIIRAKIEEGIARVSPDTVWVIREKPQANHSVNAVWETLEAHGIEPFIAPLVPSYYRKPRAARASFAVPADMDECEQAGATLHFVEHVPGGQDFRRAHRDAEMRGYCERIVVFHDITSHVTAEFVEKKDRSVAKIFVIERGKKKPARQRKGRKPVGV